MKRYIVLIAAVLGLFATGCAGRKAPEPTASENAPKQRVSLWFYFSDSGIHQAKSPADIPARKFLPWTEAIRVSDAAIVENSPALLINRLGLMTSGSSDSASALHTDSLFQTATAAGICKTDTGTAIRFYRNSFFAADSGEQGDSGGVCLAGYAPDSGKFSVVLRAADLGRDGEAQCVALDRVGPSWFASFKSERGGKVDFSYLTFASIPERGPSDSSPDITGVRTISKDEYQRSVTPAAVSSAGESLVSLLSKIPSLPPLTLRVYSRSMKSTRVYTRSGEGTSVEGWAYVSDDKTAVLFADGTFCVCPDNSSGTVHTLKLPALSTGYVYTSFILTGSTLLAAWEEQRFFETGRAGILEIPLPEGVY
jgi:hypothetical protein